MPSHFTTIGLPVVSKDELLDLAIRLSNQSESVAVGSGRYLRWSSSCGAEVWLQVNRRGEVIGINPHFSGTSDVRVGLSGRFTRPDGTALDGAFHAWADPPSKDPLAGIYPFVFDVPDFLRYADALIPSIAQAQIAAFAHELSLYASLEEYDSTVHVKPRLAARAFIPSGLFSPSGEKTEPPEAHAILAGHIRRAEQRTNDLTGNLFHWAEIETLGGVFDVVIDPELLKQPLVPGGVVTGSFWLSGRLLAYPRRRSRLRELFRRERAN